MRRVRVAPKGQRWRRLRAALKARPHLRGRFNRLSLRRWKRRVKTPRVTYVSKAPRYPGAIWLGQTANTGGPYRKGLPDLLVMHYTAAGSGLSSAKYLFREHSPSSSAHFVIDRDGTVYQICGIDLTAWHAGKSAWKGRIGINQYGIGVEFANYGYLKPTSDKGRWLIAATNYATAFVDHPEIHSDDVLYVAHKNGGPRLGWEPYTEAQLAAGDKLTEWLLKQVPTIKEIVGHDDISPGRKSDPGPAFPMWRYKKLLDPNVKPPAPPSATAKANDSPSLAFGPLGIFGQPLQPAMPEPTPEPEQRFGSELPPPQDLEDLSDDGTQDVADLDAMDEDAKEMHAMAASMGGDPACLSGEAKSPAKAIGIMGPFAGIIIAGIFQVLGKVGLDYSEADVQSAQHVWPQIAGMLALGLGSLAGIWGRWRATEPIKGGPADPKVVEQKTALEEKREGLGLGKKNV